MAGEAERVAALADGYRTAIACGDKELESPAERKILQAMVARSATDTLAWVQSRVADGNNVGKPIEELLPALEHGNVVGATLASVEQRLTKEAKGLATTAVVGGAWPVWASAILALLLGLFASSREAGAALGAVVIPALLGGGSIVGVVVRAVQTAPSAARAFGASVDQWWRSPSLIGTGAESIFRREVTQKTVDVGASPPASDPILLRLRGAARGILIVIWLLFAACSIYFLMGIGDAWSAYQQKNCVQGLTCAKSGPLPGVYSPI